MISTIDEMTPIMNESNATLVSALIGVFGALLGVVITLLFENYRRRKEQIDKAKPILINYIHNDDSKKLMGYAFKSDSTDNNHIIGCFKNTDNGVLFLDYVETETKKYYYKNNSAVDKNSVFLLGLYGLSGETLKKCTIYCHDIYGTSYKYNAKFTPDSPGIFNKITLIDSEPQRIKRRRKERQNKNSIN